jgi:hypothetical protein
MEVPFGGFHTIVALPRLLLNLVQSSPRCFYTVHPHYNEVREQRSQNENVRSYRGPTCGVTYWMTEAPRPAK